VVPKVGQVDRDSSGGLGGLELREQRDGSIIVMQTSVNGATGAWIVGPRCTTFELTERRAH
jgi:hypothetical protein